MNPVPISSKFHKQIACRPRGPGGVAGQGECGQKPLISGGECEHSALHVLEVGREQTASRARRVYRTEVQCLFFWRSSCGQTLREIHLLIREPKMDTATAMATLDDSYRASEQRNELIF